MSDRKPNGNDAEDTSREVHITSMVVRAKPDCLPAIRRAIQAMESAEIHAENDDGKLVFTLETASLGEVTECLAAIDRMEGVADATLVYHQIEQADRLDDVIEIPSSQLERRQ